MCGSIKPYARALCVARHGLCRPQVSDAVSIPVIASSGAGAPSHFTDVFKATGASAALAAGIFHRNEVSISQVKEHMAKHELPTRITLLA